MLQLLKKNVSERLGSGPEDAEAIKVSWRLIIFHCNKIKINPYVFAIRAMLIVCLAASAVFSSHEMGRRVESTHRAAFQAHSGKIDNIYYCK